jgi:hypothetical protein
MREDGERNLIEKKNRQTDRQTDRQTEKKRAMERHATLYTDCTTLHFSFVLLEVIGLSGYAEEH